MEIVKFTCFEFVLYFLFLFSSRTQKLLHDNWVYVEETVAVYAVCHQ